MARRPTPQAEVEIDVALVRALLADQHPDLAGERLTPVGSGWDNALFRLGDALAVRLPRRAIAAPLVINEQRWLKELAPRLPVPVPVALRTGAPGHGYPWSWSVTPWFEGSMLAETLPCGSALVADALGGFVCALHTPAPHDAPVSAFRGLPLADRTARLHGHVAELDGLIDRERVLRRWDELARTQAWTGQPVWIHGDLHPGNILVVEQRLAAVIDFGDLTSGDPATDIAAAWMLFDADARVVFREAAGRGRYDVDDAMWRRAGGWALALNLAWLTQSGDDAEVARQAMLAIDAVLDEW